MEFLSSFLPICLYVVAIVLLIVLIVLGIRLIKVLDKVDKVVDNVEEKINSFNGLFQVIDKATDGIATISNSAFNSISKLINRIINKKKKYEEDDDFYE
jgi:uncharacterized protein YoxC